MKISELLKEQDIVLSAAGRECFEKAIIEHFPTLRNRPEWVWRYFNYDLNDEDCLKIIQLATRYAKLWAFS